MTVASLDALHRVQRKRALTALAPLVLGQEIPDGSAGETHRQILGEARLENAARLRARFYRLRLKQQEERLELIEQISSQGSRV